uniref:AlNc14C282G10133 protein n=1 Tax=Albugo laibachii Nc14 TaxID=890382 RepID=F0WUY6_9STRA|nr:AlNc14C282G10133 [Albugo laibachii Nc14]|eukprot:CCA25222.1 AlNc14C282G10133 [Albugo laibachii Nc14]
MVIKNLPEVISTNHRRCVLAHHEALTDACHACVLQLDRAAVTTKKLTTSSFLAFLGGDFREPRLASCIIESLLDPEIKCRQFEFLPHAMCSYETLDRKIPSHKRPFSSISHVPSIAKPEKFASITAMIDAQKQKQLHQPTAPISSPMTSTDNPIEAKPPSQFSTTPNVMVATWTGNDLKCLEHLTLYYDVLLISLVRKYVSMRSVKERLLVDEFCGKLTIEKEANLVVHTLRAISVVQVRELVDDNGALLSAKRSL